MLENLDRWLDAAESYAKKKSFEPSVLLAAPGKAMKGHDYLVEMSLPNFYFHVSMVYAILRHNGVDLGKRDYIGSITMHDLASAKS